MPEPPPPLFLPPIGPENYPPEVWAALDHDRNTALPITVTVICLLVAFLVVALRIYTRRVLLNNLGLDDLFAVLSLVRAPYRPSASGRRRSRPRSSCHRTLANQAGASRWPWLSQAPSSSCTHSTV